MQLRIAVNQSHVTSSSLLEAPASPPGFDVPQLC